MKVGIASNLMAQPRESSLDPARLSLACGRISGSARAIAEAHRFGVAEGPHRHPWTAAYMHDAIGVYAAALPVTYQRDVASLFGHCADSMARQDIPASLAEDWLIVSEYLTNATSAILERLAAQPDPAPACGGEPPGIDDHEPAVVHFDRLAALTTRGGALRLEQAALAVKGHASGGSPGALDDEQMRLLKAVASGAAIADLAADLGYSQRTMYRALASLWRALGVPDRVQGIRKAATEGLLD
ncbi:MAG: hypothetical protein OXG40_05050 [Acidimicrobiaceae bacterium]|nr:hypothetical protein [Acidimicrobiaceae bacterium]